MIAGKTSLSDWIFIIGVLFFIPIAIIAIIINGTIIELSFTMPSMFFISIRYITVPLIIAVTIIGILNSCLKNEHSPAHIIQKDASRNVFIIFFTMLDTVLFFDIRSTNWLLLSTSQCFDIFMVI